MYISKAHLRLAAVAGTLAVALVLAGTVLGATLTKNGKSVTAVRTVTATGAAGTSTFSYTDMPGMSLTVTVPAGEQAMLITTFSAATRCPADSSQPEKGQCIIQVLLDGTPMPPGEVEFASTKVSPESAYGYSAQSMQFVAGPVSAGTHTVKVQFKKWTDAISFLVRDRTLTVLRSKV